MTGRLPTFVVLAVLLGGWLPSAVVSAAEDSEGELTLDWVDAAGCSSGEQVRGEIARLLGGRVAISHGGDLDARAAVEHGTVWSVKLATRHAGRNGRRSIEAPSCESAVEATALIIALMIDPDAVAANAHERDEVSAAVPVAPVSVPDSDASPEAQPIEILANLHSQASVGTLPDVDLGVGLGLGLSGRRWRAELRGTYGLRRNQVGALPSTPGAYGQFNITVAAISGCYLPGQARWAFGPCVVAEGGLVTAAGYGASTSFAKHAAWFAAGLGGYLSFALGRHLLGSVEVDLMFPLYRPEYVFQDLPGIAFQAPAVGGRALVGIGWQF